MKKELPGIAFEKLIADIQSKLDPNAEVLHNQRLVDRLGHQRQFDVVFRGKFGGQPLLGVIECKDLNRKVGNPEVDAFATKAKDVNANVKVLLSRRGFSKPALEKCRDHGIEPLMLVQDESSRKFRVGNWWRAEKIGFGLIHMEILACDGQPVPEFKVTNVKVEGRSIFESLLTYLHNEFDDFAIGWADLTVTFTEPRILSLDESTDVRARGSIFTIEKKKELFELFVPWESQGFFNFNSNLATFPVGMPIVGGAVPTDLTLWEKREDASQFHEPSMFQVQYVCKPQRFDDTINIDEL